jgi:hypothetical protein
MIGGVSIEGLDAMPGAFEAAVNKALGPVDGTVIEIIPDGKRGTTANAMIAHVQAAMQRDPFYLDEQAKEALRFPAAGLAAAQRSTVRRNLELIVELLINAIRRNVEKQRNPSGAPFRSLTAAYAKEKRQRFGFVVPILRASGDLLDGLKGRISKLR